MKRRSFLQTSSVITAGMFLPNFIKLSAHGINAEHDERRLVVIHLQGGNDGLNTIIPISNDEYYRLRPTLGITKYESIHLSDDFGFHPALSGFRNMYDQGWMSIFNGVGYPNPDRSHFRSTEIWQTAQPALSNVSDGWIGKWMEHELMLPYQAIELDDQLSLALRHSQGGGMAVSNPGKLMRIAKDPLLQKINNQAHQDSHHQELPAYLRMTLHNSMSAAQHISESFKKGRNAAEYPQGKLSQRLNKVAQLISGGAGTRVYYLQYAGFDTHIGQAPAQNRLLSQLSESLNAFCSDLKAQGKWESTLVMVFSEFGRRVEENAGKGTDHGTAGPLFLLGGSLHKSGVMNDHPSLSDLQEGDLRYSMDFRNIYAEILGDWLKSDPETLINTAKLNWGLFK